MANSLKKTVTNYADKLAEVMEAYGIPMQVDAYHYSSWHQAFLSIVDSEGFKKDELRLIQVDPKLPYNERAFQASYNIMQLMRLILTRMEHTWIITGNAQKDYLLQKLSNEFSNNMSALICNESTPYSDHMNNVFFDANSREMATVIESLNGFSQIIAQLATAGGDSRTIKITSLMSLMKSISSLMVVPVYDDKTYALNKILSQFLHESADNNDLLDIFQTPFLKTLFMLAKEFDLNNAVSPLQNTLSMLKAMAYAFDEARNNPAIEREPSHIEPTPDEDELDNTEHKSEIGFAAVIPDETILNLLPAHTSQENDSHIFEDNIDINTLLTPHDRMEARNLLQFRMLRVQYTLDRLGVVLMAEKLWQAKTNNENFSVTRTESILKVLPKNLGKKTYIEIHRYLNGNKATLPAELKERIKDVIENEKQALRQALGTDDVDNVGQLKSHVNGAVQRLKRQLRSVNTRLNIKGGFDIDFTAQFKELTRQQGRYVKYSYLLSNEGHATIDYAQQWTGANQLLAVLNTLEKKQQDFEIPVAHVLPYLSQEQRDVVLGLATADNKLCLTLKNAEQAAVCKDIKEVCTKQLTQKVFYFQQYVHQYVEVITARSLLDWRAQSPNMHLREASLMAGLLAESTTLSTEDQQALLDYMKGSTETVDESILANAKAHFDSKLKEYDRALAPAKISEVLSFLQQDDARIYLGIVEDAESRIGVDLQTQAAIKTIKSLDGHQRKYAEVKAVLPKQWQKNIRREPINQADVDRTVQDVRQALQDYSGREDATYDAIVAHYQTFLNIQRMVNEKITSPGKVFYDPDYVEAMLRALGILKEDMPQREAEEMYDFIYAGGSLRKTLETSVQQALNDFMNEIHQVIPSEKLKKTIDEATDELRPGEWGIQQLWRTFKDCITSEDSLLAKPVEDGVPALKYPRYFRAEDVLTTSQVSDTPLLSLTSQLRRGMEQLSQSCDIESSDDFSERSLLEGSDRIIAAGTTIAKLTEQAVININRVQTLDVSQLIHGDIDVIHISDSLDNLARIANSLIEQLSGLTNRDGYAYSQKSREVLFDNDSIVISELTDTVNSLSQFVVSARELIQFKNPDKIKSLRFDKLVDCLRVVFQLGLVSVDDDAKFQMMKLYQDYFEALSKLDLETGVKVQGAATNFVGAVASEDNGWGMWGVKKAAQGLKAVGVLSYEDITYQSILKHHIESGHIPVNDMAFLKKFLINIDESVQQVKHLQQIAGIAALSIKESMPDRTLSDEAAARVKENRETFNGVIRSYGGDEIKSDIDAPRSASEERVILDKPFRVEEGSIRDLLLKLTKVDFQTMSISTMHRYKLHLLREKKKVENIEPLNDATNEAKQEDLRTIESMLNAVTEVLKWENRNNERSVEKRKIAADAYESIYKKYPIDASFLDSGAIANRHDNLSRLQNRFAELIEDLYLQLRKRNNYTFGIAHSQEIIKNINSTDINRFTIKLGCFVAESQLEKEVLDKLKTYGTYDQQENAITIRKSGDDYADFAAEFKPIFEDLKARLEEEAETEVKPEDEDAIIELLGFRDANKLSDIQKTLNREINLTQDLLQDKSWYIHLQKFVLKLGELLFGLINKIFDTSLVFPFTSTSYAYEDTVTAKRVSRIKFMRDELRAHEMKYDGHGDVHAVELSEARAAEEDERQLFSHQEFAEQQEADRNRLPGWVQGLVSRIGRGAADARNNIVADRQRRMGLAVEVETPVSDDDSTETPAEHNTDLVTGTGDAAASPASETVDAADPAEVRQVEPDADGVRRPVLPGVSSVKLSENRTSLFAKPEVVKPEASKPEASNPEFDEIEEQWASDDSDADDAYRVTSPSGTNSNGSTRKSG